MDFHNIALQCAEIADDKKAANIIVMDMRELTAITNYFVICDAESVPQIRSIVEAVKKTLSKEAVHILHSEGKIGSRWVLLDYGGVVIHVFHKEARQFYNLERLWGEAPQLRWQDSKKSAMRLKRSYKKK
ncbi:MAG: ribosome silencing factor [bacterium]